jgi:hypothetical protein
MKRSANKNRTRSKPLTVPTEEDWGDYKSDLDQEHAHSVFAGRTNQEAQPFFRRNPIEATDELRWMPAIPFRYYMLAFRDFIMAGQFDFSYAADAASCFIGLVMQKLEKQPAHIVPIMAELIPRKERPLSAASPEVRKDLGMITLATAAYAHHSEVKAYRLTSITSRRIARLAAPKMTIILTFEKRANRRSQSHTARNRCIVGRLVDVHDAVSPDVNLQWVRRQRPQYIKRGCPAEDNERQHAPAAFPVRLEQQHAERQQEREESLRVQHERRAHVVRHRRRENSIQSQPDESLDELMNCE